MTVSGPWAVITGASSGIGRAFALELTGRGFPVFLIARREAELERVANEVGSLGGLQRSSSPTWRRPMESSVRPTCSGTST